MSDMAIGGRGARIWAALYRRPLVMAGLVSIISGGATAIVVRHLSDSHKPLTLLEQLEAQGTYASAYLDAFGKNIRFYNPSAFEAAGDARMLSEGYTRDWFSGVLADDTVMDVDQMRFVFKKGTWLGFCGKGKDRVSYGTPKYDVDSQRYGLIREGYKAYFDSETGRFAGQSYGPTLGPTK